MKKVPLIYFFMGTTAELVRVAPIIKQLNRKNVQYKLIFSGQTPIQTKEVEKYVGFLKPDMQFTSKVSKYSTFYFLYWAVNAFFTALVFFGKDFVKNRESHILFVIYGDPVTTSIGALVAKLYGVKVVHIESGDLSGNLLEPFPEEICRNINIRLADILFPPSSWAKNNLKKVNKPKINTHHNTLADSFWWFANKKLSNTKYGIKGKYYILIMHRQEHVMFGKGWAKRTLNKVLTHADPSLTCVLFNHPRTLSIIDSIPLDQKTRKMIKVIKPVPYTDFIHLVKKAEFLATDGATNQYEAYLLGKPCLLLRNHTEQIEGLGKNIVLYENNEKRLIDFMSSYKTLVEKPIKPTHSPGKIIVDKLLRL